jgi:tRNA threonylcarbamoyladenosine modification (KEOPS) complex Cgi121 subunit
MPPVPPAERRTLQAVGARRRTAGEPSAKELIGRLRTLNTESPALVALLDARSIAGERQLLTAWAHLGRSRGRGGSRLRDRSAEYLLYVAGDDQLPRALAKVGVAADSEQFVLVAERPHTLAPLLDRLGMVEDPTAYPRPLEESVLARLGIEAPERAIVPPASWEGLILERIAFVDLVPPANSPAKSG